MASAEASPSGQPAWSTVDRCGACWTVLARCPRPSLRRLLWTVAGVVLSLGALGFLGAGPSWRAGNSRLWAAPNEETAQAAEPTAAQREQFEAKIRPLLVEQCYACHSAKAEQGIKGGLRLDSRAGLLKGGDSGPAFDPQKPEESLLLQAVRWQGLEMPPKGKLPQASLDALAAWLKDGAPWPAESAPTDAGDTPREFHWDELRGAHWAWRPVVRPVPPRGAGDEVARNPIDLFVLDKLRAAGLALSPPAEPAVLLRRACFDLLGLPPTAEQEAWFLSLAKRDLDAALTRLVDELLASPQYGERWGRHWLDVARYSDQAGNFGGPAIPLAWRYRDWVVEAFNRDLPYDQFVRAQVVGDLLGPEFAAGTGLFALGPTYVSDGGDPDAIAQAQSETLDDRVDTLTRGLLGLTVSCARCHDHKFDPIPQLDYYSLAGVFQNTRFAEVPLVPQETVAARERHLAQLAGLEGKLKELDARLQAAQRDPNEDETLDRQEWQAEVDRLKGTTPAMYPVAHGLAEAGTADMPLAIRGNLRKPGPVAPRRFLRIVSPADAGRFEQGSGRRELAEAIASADNPLTARVFVNRVWMQHFGRGLVGTPSNFGTLGEPPSHPELLDWLAAEWVAPSHELREVAGGAWSIKRLHRLLLLSATWRQSSAAVARGLEVDAGNRWLWRMPRRRLDVEAWRDTLLACTGELDGTPGGPPEGNLLASRRRTLYGVINRNGDGVPHQEFLRLFDFPASRATSEGRTANTVPQQFLFLLNSPFMADRARVLAKRMAAVSAEPPAQITAAYQWLYGREPSAEERELGMEFLQSPAGAPAAGELTLAEQYAQMLLSANELAFVE